MTSDQEWPDIAGNVQHAVDLPVQMGRLLHIPIVAGCVAKFRFEQLCGEAVGASAACPRAQFALLLSANECTTLRLTRANIFGLLCAQLGAADYIALCEAYHTIAIEGLPILTMATRSQGYRFVTLIDIAYEHRCR